MFGKSEKVELLRWIENGNNVKACIINNKSISVDTPKIWLMLLKYWTIISLKKIQAVFDFDGVLIDSLPVMKKAWELTRDKYNLEPDFKEFQYRHSF